MGLVFGREDADGAELVKGCRKSLGVGGGGLEENDGEEEGEEGCEGEEEGEEAKEEDRGEVVRNGD